MRLIFGLGLSVTLFGLGFALCYQLVEPKYEELRMKYQESLIDNAACIDEGHDSMFRLLKRLRFLISEGDHQEAVSSIDMVISGPENNSANQE